MERNPTDGAGDCGPRFPYFVVYRIPSSPRGLRRPTDRFFSSEGCHGVISAYKKDKSLEALESKMKGGWQLEGDVNVVDLCDLLLWFQ